MSIVFTKQVKWMSCLFRQGKSLLHITRIAYNPIWLQTILWSLVDCSYIATITKIIFLVLISSWCFYRLFETASAQGDTCSVLFTDDSTTCRVSHEVILALRFVCHSELSLLYSNHMYDWTRSSYGVYLE